MTTGDFKRMIEVLKGLISGLCKAHPAFDFTKAFGYLVNAEKSVMAYITDFKCGIRTSREGFRTMVEFNLARASEEAVKPLVECFKKEAHGRVEKRIVNEVIEKSKTQFTNTGLFASCATLGAAIQALRMENYDRMVMELEKVAGLPVTHRVPRTPKAPARERPLAANTGRILRMHRVSEAPKVEEKPKEQSGRFLTGETPTMDPEEAKRKLAGPNVLRSLGELPQPKVASKKKTAEKGKKEDKKKARKRLMQATA